MIKGWMPQRELKPHSCLTKCRCLMGEQREKLRCCKLALSRVLQTISICFGKELFHCGCRRLLWMYGALLTQYSWVFLLQTCCSLAKRGVFHVAEPVASITYSKFEKSFSATSHESKDDKYVPYWVCFIHLFDWVTSNGGKAYCKCWCWVMFLYSAEIPGSISTCILLHFMSTDSFSKVTHCAFYISLFAGSVSPNLSHSFYKDALMDLTTFTSLVPLFLFPFLLNLT